MNGGFEKKKVYVVTAWLKEENEEGEPLNWSSSYEEYYADTLEEAQKIKEHLLAGDDEYYGDYVEDVWISDEKEERELLKGVKDVVNNENFVSPKQRLFVDMDGTLAVFKPVDEMETLYEKGYFKMLAPQRNVVEAIKKIIIEHPEIEVNVLSAYLTDSAYALKEKNEWLDRYLPEIDQDHRIFVACGTDKKEGIRDGIRKTDFLLDDYTKNLSEWQPPARGIKLLNGINHTRGSWAFDRLSHERESASLASAILSIMREEKQIFDDRSGHKKDSVLDKLHGKQKTVSDGREKNEKQRAGEREWQTRSER